MPPPFFLVLFSTLEGDRETLLRVMGKDPYLLDSLNLLSFRGSGSAHAPPTHPPPAVRLSLHVVLGGGVKYKVSWHARKDLYQQSNVLPPFFF